jgi:hypothetical protein
LAINLYGHDLAGPLDQLPGQIAQAGADFQHRVGFFQVGGVTDRLQCRFVLKPMLP